MKVFFLKKRISLAFFFFKKKTKKDAKRRTGLGVVKKTEKKTVEDAKEKRCMVRMDLTRKRHL